MKTTFTHGFLSILFLFLLIRVSGQTTLSPGDIAFIGINTEDPDAFAFIALKDISAGTEWFFTDNGCKQDGTLRSGEGILKFTSSGISALDVITVEYTNSTNFTVHGNGSLAHVSGSFSLSKSGDQVLSYSGTFSAPSFLTAIHFDGSGWDTDATNTNTSALPAGLTDGTDALAVDETDNALFIGALSGTQAGLLPVINLSTNWYRTNRHRLFIIPEYYPYDVMDQGSTWSTGASWHTGVLPTSNVSVIIPALTTVSNTSPVCKNLFVESNGRITIIDSGSLSVSGDLLVYSDQSKTGNIKNQGTLAVSGTTKIQRYIPGDDWHLVACPVTSLDMKTFAAENNLDTYDDGTKTDYDLAPYDENLNDWSPYILTNGNNSTDFEPGLAYALRRTIAAGNGVVVFEGPLFSGNKSVAITRNSYGWNGLGNPWPSAMHGTGSGSFLEENLDRLDPEFAGLYLWDYTLNDYRVLSGSSTQYIAPGQGFIVRSETGGGTVDFNTAMQLNSVDVEFKSAETPLHEITLSINADARKNITRVFFEENRTEGLDPMYDVGKFKGNPGFALYSRLPDGSSEVDYAVQSLPLSKIENSVIPLGIDLEDATEIQFQADSIFLPAGIKVWLQDSETGNRTALIQNGTGYKVLLPAGFSGPDRFFLLTTDDSTPAVFNPVEPPRVYTADKRIIIDGKVHKNTRFEVFGIDGKKWQSQMAENTGHNVLKCSELPAGVYLLRISHDGEFRTIKIIL